MAKTLSSYSPTNIFSWILIIVPRDVPFQISHCWIYPVAPFLSNSQKMALLWPKHGPHMVLQIGSGWILINLPKDVPCQISNCCLYPVAPFPRNCQNMVFTWSLKCFCFWILIIVPRDVPGQISHCWVYLVAPCPRNGQNMAVLWTYHGPYIVL